MNRNSSIFEYYKRFVNSLPEGRVFTRKQIKDYFDESYSSTTSVDTYRRMCEVAGYTKKGSRPGFYVKIKNIPEEFGKNDVKEEAYGYRNNKIKIY